MKLLSLVVCVVLAFGLLFGGQAHGWGKEGHQIVADIAYSLLNSNAQQAVNYYLNGLSLPASAPFPDEYDHTSQGRWSGPLHYVNMPRSAVQYTNADCPAPPSCVVAAIQNYTKQLISQGANGPQCTFNYGDMPCPLVFITHFVGDVHQPLHVGYADDAGGNTVKVDFMGKYGNLHQVWDEFMIQRYDSDWQDFSQQLQTYIQNNPTVAAQYAQVTDPAKWANESFQYTRTVVYNYNPGSDSREIDLGEDYYNANLPIVQQRLVAAGVRLGTLLNNIFSGSNMKGIKPLPVTKPADVRGRTVSKMILHKY